VNAPSFHPHPHRQSALGELHARPFLPLATPARLLHFAFMTDPAQGEADRRAFAQLCEKHDAPRPGDTAKHHRVKLPMGGVRWEQHAEFTTYTWEIEAGAEPFSPPAGHLADPMHLLPQPGPHLISVDLQLVGALDSPSTALFDSASLAMARVDMNGATAATDFCADSAGFVRILVINHELSPARAGALCQRLIEIETYRMLALLGLPEAARVAPSVKAIEDALLRISAAMMGMEGLANDHRLLDEMTALAARLEADSAISNYRFGASRAYDGIVQQRLAAIGEIPIEGWPTLAAFLARRLAPAMRTCLMLEERQATLSRKLTRAADLLRTRVDVEIERQNRDLLASMNDRTRMQLRLQQTVEGLSVAAISYYVVGLLGYVFKGAKDSGVLSLDPVVATAVAVPLAILAVALIVHRIRRSHQD
jgi:uncharacterized membrane-anchored protein